MKKLWLALAAALCLAGCGQAEPAKPESYLQPAQLTQEEEAILKLAGGPEPAIFAFAVDGQVQTVQVRTWLLQDGEWEQQSGSLCALAEGEGRISLALGDLSRYAREGVQQGDATSATSWEAPEDARLPEGLSRTTTRLTQQVPIAYGQEIPLAVQIFSSQNAVHAYDVEAFFTPEKYAQWGHEAVYAVTACFWAQGQGAG